jgi:hypothetical protein
MGRRNNRAATGMIRERLAQESARIMIEHGIVDFGLAKRKAAERLAVEAVGALPSNAQIESCLAERQRIFEPLTHEAHLSRLRLVAVEIMALLAAFEPRLVGPVLNGTATQNAAVELHVFNDSAEEVAEELAGNRISFGQCERRYRYGGRKPALVPGFSFSIEETRIVTLVFPENGLREAPLSPVDGRPMTRAARRKVLELLG